MVMQGWHPTTNQRAWKERTRQEESFWPSLWFRRDTPLAVTTKLISFALIGQAFPAALNNVPARPTAVNQQNIMLLDICSVELTSFPCHHRSRTRDLVISNFCIHPNISLPSRRFSISDVHVYPGSFGEHFGVQLETNVTSITRCCCKAIPSRELLG